MFDPANESSFRLDVAGLSNAFEVLSFAGRESISEPFVFDVDLLIEDSTLDLAGLLYRSASLLFGSEGNVIHGQLHELVQREHGLGVRLCQVRLGPKLACLARRYSQRIFSGRSVPQILDQVLGEHGIVDQDRRLELAGDYPPRDFCTQYRESDLQFLQRLCAQERLHYYFEHRADGHCVVFGEGPGNFQVAEAAVFRAVGGQPAVRRFEVMRCTDGAARLVECSSDLTTLRSGQLMPLSGHPVPEWNQPWLLTHIEHQGEQAASQTYSNTVRAEQWELPLETPQVALKPRMHSLQRAWVVDVDEPQPDPSRPVAVQFDWVYQGEGAASSHCWLPLAAPLNVAASPRLAEGTEVVVSFTEGDPDRPLITGFLHGPARVEVDEVHDPATPVLEDCPLDGVPQWLCSGEPLMLLCLLPGGGSFNHCAQALCICRTAPRLGQSGAA
ncbi:type VI secretion system Vgr family protein [Pseudomonas umsongensis]|uniref:type VI secretion system Vgr family protein n=1 Tax=Pseudomonas umsongensis TaxID=198618 RepID=UPI003ECD07C1